jgi:glutathione S-transferase
MPDYILYGHPESGHSYKAHLALRLLNLDYDYREVEVFLPRHERRKDWQSVSRFGEVPVLVDDGEPVVQSNAILLHLARKHNALGWETDPDTLTSWLFWEANRIAMSLPHIRFHAHFPVPAAKDVLDWMRVRMHDDLATLDRALDKTNFLMGDRATAADIACCGYMFFADQIPLDFATWPKVALWLERIKQLPGWLHPYEIAVKAE